MSNALEKIIERISAYEILNNIIPGTIYAVLVKKLTPFNIQTDNVWSDIILCYFIGLVIGRVGSLVVERFLKWRKKLQFEPHSEYVKAEQKDELVRELSTINNMYRTYTAVALCLIITVAFSFLLTLFKKNDWSKPAVTLIGCVLLMLIFGKSYIKQTGYVANRVKTINKLSKEESNIILSHKKDK